MADLPLYLQGKKAASQHKCSGPAHLPEQVTRQPTERSASLKLYVPPFYDVVTAVNHKILIYIHVLRAHTLKTC